MKYPIFFSSPRGRPRRAPMKRPAHAGDGRAEHAIASAHHVRIRARLARAAVRGPGAVQFVLGEQGRRPVGPVGPDAPPSPSAPSSPTGGSAALPAFFSWFPNHQIPAIIFFSHENVHRFVRSYLAPAVRCRKERPSDRRGVVQQPPAGSWEVMRSVKSITSTKHVAHLL